MMDPVIEQATLALYEGNRAAVLELLCDRASSGLEFWLLACAVEENDERLQLLKRVHAIGQQPYADMAADILRREARFAATLAEGPAWQRWLVDHRAALLRLCIVIGVLSMTLIVLALLFS
jgi:hypothetical protein